MDMMMMVVANFSSILETTFFIQTLFRQYIPPEFYDFCRRRLTQLFRFLSPYICIVIEDSDGFRESELYDKVQEYLSGRSSDESQRFVLRKPKNSRQLTLSADKDEQIKDQFEGISLCWVLRCSQKNNNRSLRWNFGSDSEEKRYYELTFKRKHKDVVLDQYIPFVVEQAEIAQRKRRQRKLYTNSGIGCDFWSRSRAWTSIPFEHPSTFSSLALESRLKGEILEDLESFKKNKKYYNKVGRAWKRGYLLYGPPGTGKSSMIAAMANHLEYDIYDLELTQVRNNSELRKLLVNTTDKSVVVIEDIDCSVDFSSREKKKKEKKEEKNEDEKLENSNPSPNKPDKPWEDVQNSVTLSGVLNFTDGLWSSCGSERIFVFTTNHVDRLDPALLRPGRMDEHIHFLIAVSKPSRFSRRTI
eukprot:TRINITY_DN1937_c0_g1_i7.p1 TRINITY_DN1937_c0_g1~~TRINITY_DN1937_c0_g1_i7.p1  ORF type:complete len:415 (+),score=22.70 TRINITY_DN1937_c0_g1_i7:226-1470(+)